MREKDEDIDNLKLKFESTLKGVKIQKSKIRRLIEEKHKLRRTIGKFQLKEASSVDTKKQFQNVFTAKEVSTLLLVRRKVGKWNNEDIVRALTLRAMSSRTYEFLRQEMRIPFPSRSTLRNWTKNFKLKPGLITNVVEMLESHLITEPDITKITSLSFDEVGVDSKICFDESRQQVLGNYTLMSVMMVRGL